MCFGVMDVSTQATLTPYVSGGALDGGPPCGNLAVLSVSKYLRRRRKKGPGLTLVQVRSPAD